MQTSAKKIFCFIRYSILTDNQTRKSQWAMGQDLSFEALRDALFASARLDQHLLLFKSITLPALQSSLREEYDLRVVVITSTELPEPHLRALHQALEPFPFAQIRQVDTAVGSMEACMLRIVETQAGHDETYASFRLDDDDAVSKSFIDELARYIEPPYAGMAISFPLGYSALFDPQQRGLTECCETYDPLNAQGLALISTRASPYRHVFEIKSGGHAKSDRLVPVMLLGHTHGWLRVVHDQSSIHFSMEPTQGAKRLTGKRHSPVAPEQITRDVSIDPALFLRPTPATRNDRLRAQTTLLWRFKSLFKQRKA